MNTATKKTIYTVNNTEFDSNYIDFERSINCYMNQQGQRQMFIMATGFVYVWQKSKDFSDFQRNLQAIFDCWNEGNRYCMSFKQHNLVARAKRYRAKGVKLKDHKAPKTGRWNNLASFAETI